MPTIDELREERLRHFAIPEPTLAQIGEAVDAYFADPENKGHGLRWSVTWAVQGAMHSKKLRTQDMHGTLTSSFTGRVYRVLEARASDGKLIKVPDQGSRREAGYYTPQAMADAKAEGARRRAETDALAQRWVKVHATLESLGFEVFSIKGHVATLDLVGWEKLLDILAER